MAVPRAELPPGITPRPHPSSSSSVAMSQRGLMLRHIYTKLVEKRAADTVKPTDRQLGELAEALEAEAHEQSDTTAYKSKIASITRNLSSDDLVAAAAFIVPPRSIKAPEVIVLTDTPPRPPNGPVAGSAGGRTWRGPEAAR